MNILTGALGVAKAVMDSMCMQKIVLQCVHGIVCDLAWYQLQIDSGNFLPS